MSTAIANDILQPVGINFGRSLRPGYWRAWFLLILPPISLILISTLVGLLGVIHAEGDRSVINATISQWVPIILLTNHGLLFALLLWFMRLDGLTMRDIGWTIPLSDRRGLAVEICIGILAGIVLFVLHQYVWQWIVNWLAGGLPDLRTTPESAPIGNNLAVSVASGIVLGGLIEEQLYRGYVLTRLTEKVSLPIAVASMLFFFSLMHFGLGWTGMLVVILTGLMLTLVFIWRRSLYAAVIAHALINTLVLLL